MTCRSTCHRCTTARRSSGTSTPTASPGAGTPSKPAAYVSSIRHYRLGHHDRFAFFSHTILSWKTRLERSIDPKTPSFIEDAARGALPSVAWIDPNFSNFNPIGFRPNDDHVPADIRDGQDLVLAVYHALATSPHWERTLLIVFYDEHGGFFDHAAPPEALDDDPATFGRYGVRVPALIVSPWIEPGSVSHTLFDHTSIIKTILLRFCPDALTPPPGHQALPSAQASGRPTLHGTARGAGQRSGGTPHPRRASTCAASIGAHRWGRGTGRSKTAEPPARPGADRAYADNRSPGPDCRGEPRAEKTRASGGPAVDRIRHASWSNRRSVRREGSRG